MINRTTLQAGGYYVTKGGQSWRGAGPGLLELVEELQPVSDPLKGKITSIVTNRYVRFTHTPLYRDPSDTDAIFFPWISMAATPPGTQIFTGSDVPTVIVTPSLTYTILASAVTKMPPINAGANKPILGSMEIIGVNANGTDPSNTSSFLTIAATSGYAAPAIPGTATLARQKWTAVFGSNTGWTSLQSYDAFAISHNLALKWWDDNGQWIGASIGKEGYEAACMLTPTANTTAQMASQMTFSGSGAAQGQRIDAYANDLVISGAVSGSFTLKNASIVEGKINFDPETLAQGPVKIISAVGDSAGAAVASLILS